MPQNGARQALVPGALLTQSAWRSAISACYRIVAAVCVDASRTPTIVPRTAGPSGGTGRRARLKIWFPQGSARSSRAWGTKLITISLMVPMPWDPASAMQSNSYRVLGSKTVGWSDRQVGLAFESASLVTRRP